MVVSPKGARAMARVVQGAVIRTMYLIGYPICPCPLESKLFLGPKSDLRMAERIFTLIKKIFHSMQVKP
jgi:hypothetical protein